MSNYLVEIGVEELPAGFVPEAVSRLSEYLATQLLQNHIKYDEIKTLATPRRLTAIVKNIASMQETTSKKVKGPPVKNSFDKDGNALDAAKGFAQRNGLTVDKLTREDLQGVTYLYADVVTAGKPTEAVLPEIIEKVIAQISGERLMRWGACEVKFSRPLRWFVSLLDDKVVPFSVAGVTANRISRGHRILAPGQVTIKDADSYESALEKAFVMVDAQKRQEKIKNEVQSAAKSLKGYPLRLNDSGLLEEVVYLTEWPKAVVGDFEGEYLSLPSMLIETIMVHHQRYFPVSELESVKEGQDSKLLPHFITIANNDLSDSAPKIKQGNERVLRARLADGKFFYFDDGKQTLTERKPNLAKLNYQEGLGSYLDKTERLVKAAQFLASELKLDKNEARDLERACELAKLDLVTGLVRELPELQGYVGSWYGAKQSESPQVVAAIASHYSPRGGGDSIPADKIGQLTAVIDKIDHVVGLFALGKKPTGSSDPFGLRRAAQGVIDILVDGVTGGVDISSLVQNLLAQFESALGQAKFDHQAVLTDVNEFLQLRLKTKLLDKQYSREIVDCVLGAGDPLTNVSGLAPRLTALNWLVNDRGGTSIVRMGVRVGNILKADSPVIVHEDKLSEVPEKELWQAFKSGVETPWNKSQTNFRTPVTQLEYEEMLGLLGTLTGPVENFFEKILVNDEDQDKRNNRHAILKNIDMYLKTLGDFTKLQPLIN